MIFVAGPAFAWVAYYFYDVISGIVDQSGPDLLSVLILAPPAFAPMVIDGLCDRYKWARERKRENLQKAEILREIQRKHEERRREHAAAAGLPVRTDLYVVGPPPFMHTVYRVLDELRAAAPRRYHEAVTYLPKAVFDSSLEVAGRADGLFAYDGSGHIDRGGGWYTYNDYDAFRHTFLHEVGHNVRGKQRDDWSEDAANEYAATVIWELTA
jgi:hypothetical protein